MSTALPLPVLRKLGNGVYETQDSAVRVSSFRSSTWSAARGTHTCTHWSAVEVSTLTVVARAGSLAGLKRMLALRARDAAAGCVRDPNDYRL